MKSVFAYTRVSTVRQGTQGSSLAEQKAAIERYASANSLTIVSWFEEQETAAKQGRPVFSKMLKRLKNRETSGVIIHKIDRSARNLKDWADLGELVDRGIEIYLAHESLDLKSRGGRLAADIQAVVAADYIRNLRQEVAKGIAGRLKQGLWPWPAPPGYLDQGGGKPKIPDPHKAPLIRRMFELYSTGEYSLHQLAEEAGRTGLRGRNGAPISRNGLSTILHNEFYTGVMVHKRKNERYVGVHEPLISTKLFQRVQTVLSGKHIKKIGNKNFTFRQLLKCADCGRFLTGEQQKGRVYYRCHNRACRGVGIREDRLSEQLAIALKVLALPQHARDAMHRELYGLASDMGQVRQEATAVQLAFDRSAHRLSLLTDRYLDDDIDRNHYLTKKDALIAEQSKYRDRLNNLSEQSQPLVTKVEQWFELQKTLEKLATSQNTLASPEIRKIAKDVGSNFAIAGKNLRIDLKSEFKELKKFKFFPTSGATRATSRTFRDLRTIAESIFEIWKNDIVNTEAE